MQDLRFGINFTAKGSVYVVESSGQASLKVKVTWDLQPNKD
ncbi:CU044_2847 family protein [Trichocoleus sp. FACHB-591]